MSLATLRENAGARPKRSGIGRGHGSGMVKTGGEGGKGQTVRSGGGKGPAFEGGQTPWARRLPHEPRLLAEGAATSATSASKFAVVNLERARRLGSVGRGHAADAARQRGWSRNLRDGVKILGGVKAGKTLPAGLTLRDVIFSASARDALAAAGANLEPDAPGTIAVLNNLRAAILVPDIRKRIGFVLGRVRAVRVHDSRPDSERERGSVGPAAAVRDVL